jgi:hypothetical protein
MTGMEDMTEAVDTRTGAEGTIWAETTKDGVKNKTGQERRIVGTGSCPLKRPSHIS